MSARTRVGTTAVAPSHVVSGVEGGDSGGSSSVALDRRPAGRPLDGGHQLNTSQPIGGGLGDSGGGGGGGGSGGGCMS
jgi:hypothetical protein